MITKVDTCELLHLISAAVIAAAAGYDVPVSTADIRHLTLAPSLRP